MIRNDRNRDGGGVCIYVKSSLAFNQRVDLHDPKLEAVWVEILLPMSKPFIIGICYRSQIQSEADFTNKLDNVLTKLPNDSDVIILGDMNMCSIRFDAYYKKYQDMLTTSEPYFIKVKIFLKSGFKKNWSSLSLGEFFKFQFLLTFMLILFTIS